MIISTCRGHVAQAWGATGSNPRRYLQHSTEYKNIVIESIILIPFPHSAFSMGRPTNSRVGRNGQVLSIIGVLAVLRFGSGAGVPVLGPTTSVLPTRMASVQALPVEDTDNHLSLLGIREEAHPFPPA